jgi:hypothetical protein
MATINGTNNGCHLHSKPYQVASTIFVNGTTTEHGMAQVNERLPMIFIRATAILKLKAMGLAGLSIVFLAALISR